MPSHSTLPILCLRPRVLRREHLRGLAPRLIRLGRPVVRLDLRRVEMPTADGLGGLVSLHKELRAAGIRLTLGNVRETAYGVFEAAGLADVLDVRPS